MIEFSIIDLFGKTREIEFETKGNETAFIILSGVCNIKFDEVEWNNVGARKTVFEGKAWSAYIPRQKTVKISTAGKVKIAVVQSPIDEDTQPYLKSPDKVKTFTLGSSADKREAHFVIDGEVPSKRLFVGEAIVDPGNWAGFPPHKHDEDDMPDEAILEEFYYFLFNPEQGFGMQRVYTADGSIDEAYVVKSDDMVEFPKGYHPIVNTPGYSCYFLWAMAGDHKGFYRKNDPAHDWFSAVGNIMAKG